MRRAKRNNGEGRRSAVRAAVVTVCSSVWISTVRVVTAIECESIDGGLRVTSTVCSNLYHVARGITGYARVGSCAPVMAPVYRLEIHSSHVYKILHFRSLHLCMSPSGTRGAICEHRQPRSSVRAQARDSTNHECPDKTRYRICARHRGRRHAGAGLYAIASLRHERRARRCR